MHLSYALLTVPVLASAVAISSELQDATFTLQQIISDGTVTPAQRMIKAMRRHGKSASPAVIEAAAAALNTANITSKNYKNSLYTVPVKIGGKTFHMDFTTGTSDLTVYSTLEPTSEQHNKNHSYYTPGSSAKILDGLSWNISFSAKTSVAGVVYADKVSLGKVTATSQAVEVATSVSHFKAIEKYPFDGELGMGFRKGSAIRPKAKRPATFFESVAPSLAKPLFTVQMLKNKPGSFDFGFIDDSKYAGNISYVALNANGTKYGTWEFDAGEFAINDESDREALGDTIVDSGTTQIFVAERLVSQFFTGVSGAQFNKAYNSWVVPCNATLPSFRVALGLNSIEFGGKNMIMERLGKGKKCISGLQSRESIGAPVNIFGDVFLRTAFVVFDHSLSTPRLGFASQT